MKLGVVLMLAASWLGVVDRPEKKKPKADPAQQELQFLQGNWTVIGWEVNGRQYTQQMLQRMNMKLVIKGNQFTREMRGRPYAMTFTFDPTKNPKAMDLTMTNTRRKYLAIYSLEGNVLRICQSTVGTVRPTEFGGQKGGRTLIMTWQRVK